MEIVDADINVLLPAIKTTTTTTTTKQTNKQTNKQNKAKI